MGGPTAATLLLTLLYLTTRSASTNGKIVESTRFAPSAPDRIAPRDTIAINDDNVKRSAEFLAVGGPGKINNEIPTLVDNQSDVQGRDIVPSGSDQQVDQSGMVIPAADDTVDPESLEHALAIAEYEPQRIVNKAKMKTGRSNGLNSDSAVPSSENAALPDVDNTYYEVPRSPQPKKLQQHSKPAHEAQKSPNTESKLKPRDTDYLYPVAGPAKVTRQGYSKDRPSTNPQTTTSTDSKDHALRDPQTTASLEDTDYLYPVAGPAKVSRQGYSKDSPSRNPQTTASTDSKDHALRDPQTTASLEDTDYLYPVAGPAKVIRQGYSKDRASRNPQTTASPEDPKLENTLPPKISPLYNSYSSSPGDPRGSKHYAEPASVVAPSLEDSNSAKALRRKKTRKRLAEKAWNRLDAARSQDTANGYVGDPPTTRSASKSRRLASLVKYDAVPRSVPPKTSRKSGLENLPHESTASSGYRGSNNGNPRPSAPRSNDGESNGGDLRTTDPIKSPPGLNRKLHGRKDNRRSSAERTRVTSSPPVPAERQKSLEYTGSVTGRTLVPYGIQQASEETNLSGDKRLGRKSLQTGYRDDLEAAPVTPGLDVYQNIKAPGVVAYTASPDSTTELPSTPTNPYAANLAFYPTQTPGQRYQVSTEATWVPLNHESHWGSGEMKTDGGETDEVAESTSLESDEYDSNDERRVEVRETPDEGHLSKPGDSVQDRQEYLQDERDGQTDDKHNQYDGNKHQQGKDDVEHGGDSLHQPTQENQRHRSTKDGGGGGGDSKFEKGEGAEHMEGHHASEGEEGKKVYKSWHDHEEANKGHSDKERQSNHYDEKDGEQKEHEEEGGYHQQHKGGEKSAKEAEFDEKGEHQKGYNTKGQHSVHKKDEYEKRTEFFDEFNEDGEEEEDGDYHHEHEHAKGGHEKVSHHKEGDHAEKYGKEGKHEKGEMHHEEKGHKISEGRDTHYDHDNMHGKKEKHEGGKKWEYKKGDEGNAGEKDKKSD